MGYLLYIDSTVRPAGVSRTARLGEEFLRGYREAHPDAEVRVRCLPEMGLKPHTWESLQQRDALLAAGQESDARFELAREFAEADTLVMAAPFWDLSFPAYLKLYFENVSCCGITFGFDGNRMFGRCRCRKVLFLTTRGGVFSGVDSDMEQAMPQLRAYSKMFGLGEVDIVFAEGIDLDTCDGDALLQAAAARAYEAGLKF